MQTDQLKLTFTGKIILPEDSSYVIVQNTLMSKGAPAVVLQPLTSHDVMTALKYGVDNKLQLSVRSGGHSAAGFSTNTGGLVIDLSSMNKITLLDEAAQLVKIEAGARWGEVANVLEPLGLAISSGDTVSVGVGGLTVGGGLGWMVRKYGLAIDSLKAAEVVTADGKIIRTSETEAPDLFWAIRGGGSNFGIITSFEFTAIKLSKVYSGTIVYSLDNVKGFLEDWRSYMATADEALTTIVNILPSFAGNPPMLIQTCCYADDDESKAMQAINPLLLQGKVLKHDIKVKNYGEVLEEAHPPEGMKVIVNNAFVRELTDEVISAIMAAREAKEDLILQLRSLGGAMSRVPADQTAFAHRDKLCLLVVPTFLTADASAEQIEAEVKPWETIAQLGEGAYSGFVSISTPEYIDKLYPAPTLARLKQIKKQYDPQNIFNQNYNIVVTD